MKTIMQVTFALVATTLPAQEPATGLQDLIGAKGRDGEYQLQQRGYQFIRTEKSGGNAYSYWQETENGQCITVRTSNGRYASIVYAPAFDCRGGAGAPTTKPAQGSVRGLEDLVGVRASYAYDEMERRGYTQAGSQNDMDNLYSFWRENRTGRCVAARTSDGHFQDIYYTSNSDCSGNQGYGGDSYGGGYSESGGVTLYRDLSFGGTSERFTSDVPDLRSSRIGNDQATSVRVERGCTAQLFTDINYRGVSIELSADESDLRRSRIGNDNISSMRVRCGGYGSGSGGGHSGGSDEWGDSNAPYGVTLYHDINFRGTSETFTGDNPDLRNSRIGNDQASSVRVSPGCRARLYQDINYGGGYAELNGDENDLRSSSVGNDSVTSIRVRCN